ncbi:MAG: DNA repair protein RadA [Bifidobacteriaceae bacterium]|jgi:DNA repair protein RadA/Sms|nr:DNA repair protein RadA [Bifidobacteriaceae bacterium]
MAKTGTSSFECDGCGWTTPKWAGRCGRCGAWDTVQPVAAAPSAPGGGGRVTAASVVVPAQPIDQVSLARVVTWPTGVGELDRVLGGGIVPGSVVLLGGEPGVGKSTLLLSVAARAARQGRAVLYATGEETPQQVRLRAERIGAVDGGLKLAACAELAELLGLVVAEQPDLLVVDSIQTLHAAQLEGTPGGVAHLRAVTAALVAEAKVRQMACLLVGHVTKDGSVAGPRTLEHLVDAVCLFEGDKAGALRLLRATKNRFGPADEVGCFEMAPGGIQEVPDPSGLFLEATGQRLSGSCAGVAMEGRRAMAIEIQALVASTHASNPRRATSGLDGSRLAMVLAVLQRRCGVSLGAHDVYASTVGGAKLADPALDLALALACASARWDLVVPERTVALGEVGLGGQIRPVPALSARLAEAARLGLTTALVPPGGGAQAPAGVTAIEVGDLRQAMRTLTAGSPEPSPSVGAAQPGRPAQEHQHVARARERPACRRHPARRPREDWAALLGPARAGSLGR